MLELDGMSRYACLCMVSNARAAWLKERGGKEGAGLVAQHPCLNRSCSTLSPPNPCPKGTLTNLWVASRLAAAPQRARTHLRPANSPIPFACECLISALINHNPPRPSKHPCTHQHIRASINASVHPSTHPCIHQRIHASWRAAARPTVPNSMRAPNRCRHRRTASCPHYPGQPGCCAQPWRVACTAVEEAPPAVPSAGGPGVLHAPHQCGVLQ